MMRLPSVLILICVAPAAGYLPSTPRLEAQVAAKRVILFIGDGMGTSYWTAAAFAADDLAVKQFSVVGLVDTRSSSSRITDSAAAATAYAAGVKTYNGAIGVDPDSNTVTTVLEIAQQRGMATGLVATSSITHATPAAFAAHVPDRDMEYAIAQQIAEHEVDVILGGGRRYFDGSTRPDSVDLLSRLQEQHTYAETAQEFRSLDTGGVQRLIGFFAREHLPSAPRRAPSLPEMATTAIEILSKAPNGFFLMVEGSQPDWRGHDNAVLEAVTAEVLDFDRAIAVGLEYQSRNPETLIVVVGDHETGGLAVQLAGVADLLRGAAAHMDTTRSQLIEAGPVLNLADLALLDSTRVFMARLSSRLRREARSQISSSTLVARYTTDEHTASMLPLFASGPGAERFGGIKENSQIGQLLLETVRR
jgi:alkaline phosphatase